MSIIKTEQKAIWGKHNIVIRRKLKIMNSIFWSHQIQSFLHHTYVTKWLTHPSHINFLFRENAGGCAQCFTLFSLVQHYIYSIIVLYVCWQRKLRTICVAIPLGHNMCKRYIDMCIWMVTVRYGVYKDRRKHGYIYTCGIM